MDSEVAARMVALLKSTNGVAAAVTMRFFRMVWNACAAELDNAMDEFRSQAI